MVGDPKDKSFSANSNEFKWVDNGPHPKDVTSLIINIMVYRLTQGMSLDVQLCMAPSGKFIYLTMKADEIDLCRIAEEEQYTM